MLKGTNLWLAQKVHLCQELNQGIKWNNFNKPRSNGMSQIMKHKRKDNFSAVRRTWLLVWELKYHQKKPKQFPAQKHRPVSHSLPISKFRKRLGPRYSMSLLLAKHHIIFSSIKCSRWATNVSFVTNHSRWALLAPSFLPDCKAHCSTEHCHFLLFPHLLPPLSNHNCLTLPLFP